MDDRARLVMSLRNALARAECIQGQIANLREAQTVTRAQLDHLTAMLDLGSETILAGSRKQRERQVLAFMREARKIA